GCDGPGRALDGVLLAAGHLPGRLRRGALMTVPHAAQALGHLAAQVVRLAWDGSPVLPEHPGREHRQARVLRDEGLVLEPPARAESALDPPRRLRPHLHARLAHRIAQLPR